MNTEEGWKYIESDTAYHYFRNNRSLCGLFTMRKGKLSQKTPKPDNCCIKCAQSAPHSASNLSSAKTSLTEPASPGS